MNSSQLILGRYLHTRGSRIAVAIFALVCVLFFVTGLSQVSALTTVPTKMNFQGRLTDSAGNIMPNGTYNMKLRLYTVSSGGSAVWTEDRLVSATQGVAIVNGLFSVKLGDVTSLPANLFASGELYLEVELPTPASATTSSPVWTEGAMTPRNQMATSAYAYNSETLDGIDSTGFIQNTTSPQTADFNITGNGVIGGTLGVTGATTMAGQLTLSYATISDNPPTQLMFGNAYDSLGVPSANKMKFFDGGGGTVGIGVSTFDLDFFSVENFKFHRHVSGVLTEDIAVISSTGITSVGTLQGTRLISTVATGTAPLTVASTTKVANLNVDSIDGLDSTAFAQLGVANNTFTGTITLAGDTTANRPASPTEGMIYFDTTTKQLLTYANGKWQADRTDSVIVAASNSSQADKDAADYVADGNTGAAADGDQVQINAALTAASGKKVVLLAGTYVADATILIPNNTTLSGVGNGTLIELADIDVTDNLIENSDTTTGTGVVIRDLKTSGRKDLNTIGTQRGIHLINMGDVTTGAKGANVQSVVITNFRQDGLYLDSSDLNTVSGVTASGNSNAGIFVLSTSASNNITGNTTSANGNNGFTIAGNNNTIAGNNASSNTSSGFSISGTNNTVTGNTSVSNIGDGFVIGSGSSGHTINGNTSSNNTLDGIEINGSNNTVTGNSIVNNSGTGGSHGMDLFSADNNVITGNRITDTAGTGYAINISNSSSDTNYLADNYYSGTGASSINDLGTGTIYAGQVNSSGNFVIQPAGTVELMKNTNVTGTLQVSGNVTASSGTFTVGTTGVAGNVVISDGSSNTATIAVGNLAGNYTYSIPVTTANDTFCLATLANCVPTTPTTQATYTASTGGTTPEVKLDATRGGFDIQDSDTTIASSLFAVRGSNGSGLGSALFGVNSTGIVTAQNSANSTAAFSINNATAASLFVVDTTNSRVQIGNATADATGVILVLDTKNDAGDPTGVDGAMYYNSSSKSFRCYQNGAWRSCIGGLASSNTAVATVTGTTAGANLPATVGLSHTIPAGDCQPGRVYRASIRGVLTSANIISPGNVTIRLKLASGTILGTSGAMAPGQNKVNRMWQIDFNLLCRTYGASGTVEGQGLFVGYPAAAGTLVTAEFNNNPTGITLDLTAAQTLQVDATFTIANATNTVTVRQFVVESLGP